MSDVLVHVANYLGGGETREDFSDGSSTINTIRLQLGKQEIVIRQDLPKHRFKSDLNDRSIETTTIRVVNVRQGREEAAVRVVEDLCWMLSLAAMCRVVPFSYEYPVGQFRRRWGAHGTARYFRPTLDIGRGKIARTYLELTYDTFRRLKRRRKLAQVIDAFVLNETGKQPIEIRLVAAFVILEMLKDCWARERKMPFKNGAYWRIARRSGKQYRYGFKRIVRTMLAEVGIRRPLAELVRHRNALIHSGGLRLRRATKSRALDECQELIQTYLLTLLGYRGPYFPYGKRLTVTI